MKECKCAMYKGLAVYPLYKCGYCTKTRAMYLAVLSVTCKWIICLIPSFHEIVRKSQKKLRF